MRLQRRDLIGLSLATGVALRKTPIALAQGDDATAYFQQAKIDWQQANGQSLTMALNKHPFTESLLPLIPEFKRLTGINVNYLILPEDEYFTKLAADLSQQRGEFSVIMTAPTRNWGYVPPDWILPLDPFLNDPKLTDQDWYKPGDFYPALIAAGQAGMIVDADFFAATYEDPRKSKVAGNVGYALIPAGPGGTTYANLSTWSLGINKAAKNRTAAWLFVSWATSQRTLLNATLGYNNYNPSRMSVTKDPRVQSTMGGWGGGSYVKVVEKNLETARVVWTPEPERSRVGDTWARALQAIYFQRASAAAALKQASTEIDTLFEDAGLK